MTVHSVFRKTLEEQFTKAYDQYADAIFRHCYFRVFNREKAKDLMQETFTKTWGYLINGHEVENLRAFLYRVANNLVIDESRKKREQSLDEMKETTGFDVSYDERKRQEQAIDAHFLLSVVQALDEKYREVVLLRYVDGFSPKEIATLLNETKNVISVRIHRGINQIKELLNHKKKS